MGKNRPSIALEGVRTLGKIADNHRDIKADCTKCRAERKLTHDDISALIEKCGRDYSLVGRRCKCRLTPGCDGWNRFRFRQACYYPMWTDEDVERWWAIDAQVSRSQPPPSPTDPHTEPQLGTAAAPRAPAPRTGR